MTGPDPALWQRVEPLLDELLDLDPPAQRQALAAIDDAEVREWVGRMLEADRLDQVLLDQPLERVAADFVDVDEPEEAEQPLPERVGHFRVLRELGEGGMAVVYLAERADGDFQQTVALKLLAPARHTAHWRERFLQERQILATLNHANIAQLVDGGITDDGRPYFALEYVDGDPITSYCDAHRMALRDRLTLMLAVCAALSYAHRNLVIHRDLKPSNILVDDNGIPKLLDFGIAKLLGDEDVTLTATGHRALTPGYAAPEQFTGDAATTATDVYALGVLLYELLIGRRPFTATTQSALEIERKVLSEEPPAFRKLTSGLTPAEREEIATARGRTWPRLLRDVSSDLETIVFAALRKDPDRRYATVQALADDIQRYLEGQPVKAQADSGWYRARKFVGRHRVGVVLSGIAILGLITSTAFAVYQADQAERAAATARLEAARAKETRDFLVSLFEYASPDRSLGERLTARRLLDLGAKRVDDELAAQPGLRGDILQILAVVYRQLGLYEDAQSLAERSTALAESSAQSVQASLTLATILRQRGQYEEAEQQLAEAERRIEASQDDAHRSELLAERGELLREQADFAAAIEALQGALELHRSRGVSGEVLARDYYRLGTVTFSSGDANAALNLLEQAASELENADLTRSTLYATIDHDRGVMLLQQGDLDGAEAALLRARAARERLLDDQHPDVALTLKELAIIARRRNQPQKAEALLRQALAINEQMLGESHPETAITLNSLAVLYQSTGDAAQALQFARRAVAGAEAAYGADHPTIAVMNFNIGSLLRVLERADEAMPYLDTGLAIVERALGAEHMLTGVGMNAKAGVYHDTGQLDESETTYRTAVRIFTASAGAQHPHLVKIHGGLGRLLADMNRVDEAREQFAKAADVGRAALPEAHPDVSVVELERAGLLAAAGTCDDAVALRERHLPIVEAAGHAEREPIAAALRAIERCADDTPNSP